MTYLGQRLRPIDDYWAQLPRSSPDIRGAESSLGGTSPSFRKGLARKSQRDYSNKHRQLNCLRAQPLYRLAAILETREFDSLLFWNATLLRIRTTCFTGPFRLALNLPR